MRIRPKPSPRNPRSLRAPRERFEWSRTFGRCAGQAVSLPFLLLAMGLLGSSEGAAEGESSAEGAPPVERSAEAGPEPASTDALNLPPTPSVTPTAPNPPTGALGGRAGQAGPGLDALLKLPNQYRSSSTPSVAGTSEAQWRKRFQQAIGALTEARRTLAKNKAALDGVASSGGGSQWAVAAPGVGGGGDPGAAPNSANSPVSFKLRQALRENRVQLDEAEKALRDLTIQADLAGVPSSWRGSLPTGEGPPPEVGQLLD